VVLDALTDVAGLGLEEDGKYELNTVDLFTHTVRRRSFSICIERGLTIARIQKIHT